MRTMFLIHRNNTAENTTERYWTSPGIFDNCPYDEYIFRVRWHYQELATPPPELHEELADNGADGDDEPTAWEWLFYGITREWDWRHHR